MRERDSSMVYGDLSMFGRLSRHISYSKILSNLIEGNWIDIMCGYNADLLRKGKKHFKNINYINEIYAHDVNLDKKLSFLNINIREGFIKSRLNYRNKYFNNITIVDGLEHLLKPQDILKECYRLLDKNGVLQVMVPTWFGKPFLEYLAFKINNKQAYMEMDDHKMYYDEKTLWPMLVSAGFRPHNIYLKRFKLFCSLYVKAIKT